MTDQRPAWNIQQNKSKYIIRQNSTFRMRWDLIVCLLAVYNCCSIPLEVAFAIEGLYIWERIVDALFLFDLILNFVTTYTNNKTGFEVFKFKMIALNYITTGRFFIDLGATIPFELILEAF